MKNSKKTILAIALLLLAGCEQAPTPEPTWVYDQCARREMMKECLGAVPAGPKATQYNDWAEVVEECATTAARQSVRSAITSVKPECRGN